MDHQENLPRYPDLCEGPDEDVDDGLDCLALSGTVKAREHLFVSATVQQRLVEAHDFQAFAAEMGKNGYLLREDTSSPLDIFAFFDAQREALFSEMDRLLPVTLTRFFRISADFQNLRIILKSRAGIPAATELFSGAGTANPFLLRQAVSSRQNAGVPPWFLPVLADIARIPETETGRHFGILHRHDLRMRTAILRHAGSGLTDAYAALETDLANLTVYLNRELFSAGKMEWREYLEEGGLVSPGRYDTEEALGLFLERAYPGIGLPLTGEGFEAQATRLRMGLLRQARSVPDGIEVLFAYTAARDIEISGLQRLALGKLYGLPPEVLSAWTFPAYT